MDLGSDFDNVEGLEQFGGDLTLVLALAGDEGLKFWLCPFILRLGTILMLFVNLLC